MEIRSETSLEIATGIPAVANTKKIEADTPARYNADPDRLFESSGDAARITEAIALAAG